MHALRKALTLVGIVCLIATIIHGMWFWYIPTYPEMKSLTPVQLDTIQLMNAAITLFLLVMSVATLVVARSATLSPHSVRLFTLFLIAFWAARFVLELVMPLRIPLLIIEHPGLIAKVIMILPVIVLAIPLLRSSADA